MADFKLLSILTEILTEVGDLKNIHPYNWSQTSVNTYSFDIDDNKNIEIATGRVAFYKLSQQERYTIKFSPAIEIEKVDTIENITYYINDTTDQAEKTDLSLLIHISKTVTDIVNDRIQNTVNTAFIIFEDMKTGELGSDQKMLFYKAIARQNLPTGYRGSKIMLGEIEGYCISPINK